MSTWRMFPDGRDDFRWEITGQQQLQKEEQCDAVREDTRCLPSMSDLLLLGSSKLLEDGDNNVENLAIFRTGWGKPVELKQSSIARARSVLGEIDGHLDGRENGHASLKPMLGTNPLKTANMLKSGLHSVSENVINMLTSMFQTGLGKTVNISSAGLLRAKTLLGLDKYYDQEQIQKQSASTEVFSRENPFDFTTQDPNNVSFGNCTNVLTSSTVKSGSCGSKSMKFLDCMKTAPEPPPVKFHTAGGRSISVSSDALQRARSLLGNPEFDSLLDEATTTDSLFSVTDDGRSKNDFSTPFSPKGIENGHSSLGNFTSPLRSSSYKKHSFSKSERLQIGNNLITQFDAEAAINNSTMSNGGSTGDGQSPTSNSYLENRDCLENAIHPKIDPSKRFSSGALVDISNTMNIDHVDNRQCFGEERRFRRINSVSPFKKPRSLFVTPLNKNKSSNDIYVLSRLAPKETSCKQRVSLRYPCQVQRAYLTEYVLQPASHQEKDRSSGR